MAPIPYDLALEVAVLPMKERVRRKTLDSISEHKSIMTTIKGQTAGLILW